MDSTDSSLRLPWAISFIWLSTCCRCFSCAIVLATFSCFVGAHLPVPALIVSRCDFPAAISVFV